MFPLCPLLNEILALPPLDSPLLVDLTLCGLAVLHDVRVAPFIAEQTFLLVRTESDPTALYPLRSSTATK